MSIHAIILKLYSIVQECLEHIFYIMLKASNYLFLG